MKRSIFLPLVAAAMVSAHLSAADVLPHWIWTNEPGSQRATFQHNFTAPSAVQSASLRAVADFCLAGIWINGRPVGAIEPYGPALDIDVTAAIRAGQNELTIQAAAVPGPAAVALHLAIVAPNGTRQTIVTDETWRGAKSAGEALPALFGIGRRPPTIDPFDNYEQWRQAIGAPSAASAAAFWTAPSFEITLVRAAPSEEGSWVSLAFDPQGRATIAREEKGLLRMTLADDRRSVAKVETIDDTLLECRGLLYAHGALYASANNSKGLYRLRDADGDGRFDETKLLRELSGSVGHGRNDLALGPDGSIYWISGDSVDLPRENVVDRTSPFREARRGQTTREGFVLRTDRDGAKWELIAAGLRNPFGIALNEQGDAFTYDADAEFDMGSPWYRPTRVVQLAAGSDFGWRGVTGKWPPYFPDHADNALPALDIGRGSPTAVMFGTDLKFPADYKRSLLILDWTYGRILAVHLLPRGAGYRGAAETLLKGRPLNVTDLAAGPDGALYLVTGGRKTQSALYRLAFTGAERQDSPPSPHEKACQDHAQASRAVRKQLEQLHQPSAAALDAAWAYLNDHDPRLRYAAMVATEHQPVDQWRERALKEKRPMAALTALVALARGGDAAALEALLELPAGQFNVGQLLLLVQSYLLLNDAAPAEVASRKQRIIAQLDPLFPHPAAAASHVSPAGTAASLNRDLARLLAALDAPGLVERVAKSLLASPAQENRLHGLFVLRNVKSGWTSDTRRAYFTALNDGAKYVAGEGMPKFLAQIREQAVLALTDAERRELADLLEAKAIDDEPLPPARPLVKRWMAGDFEKLLADPDRRGDAERGSVVFREALCARCHRAGARGPAVGPDLTHVAGRFSPRDLLDSILTPNRVVAENYRGVQVRTTDGRTITGRVLLEGDYRSEKLRLSTQPLAPAEFVELDKKQIEEVRESPISPMPEGLLDGFRESDVLDLLTFLTRASR